MQLTNQQNIVFDKVKDFLKSDASVFILKGYAGTGKTTMIKHIVEYVRSFRDCYVAAPTGRAARVLNDKVCRYIEGTRAYTIHKTIYSSASLVVKQNVKDIADTEYKLLFPVIVGSDKGNNVTIVDEASMVCSRKMEHELFVFGTDNLMDDLLTFVRPSFGGKVIFVGDPAQLPPVGESKSNALDAQFFRDKGLKVVECELTEVIRQSGDSVILKNAMKIRDVLFSKQRNALVFDEKEGDVETVNSGEFLQRYLDYRKASGKHDSVIICYTNEAAAKYNKDIRKELYGDDVPLNENDILLIVQNNYLLDRMNGEFVPVLFVGERISQSAPVYIQDGGVKKRVVITFNFVHVRIPDSCNVPRDCMLLENLLLDSKGSLSIDETRALYINFCLRHNELKPGSKEFSEKLETDLYFNAVRAKYGYAVTGHKCQGGEWAKVFVDYTGRTGLNDECLRWAYTATTRARKTLYVSNLPHITPFQKFRIEKITACSKISDEFRVLGDVKKSPFHPDDAQKFLHAKYQCINDLLYGTPYRIESVVSKPYQETYTMNTPGGLRRFDIRYNKAGLFHPCVPQIQDEYAVLVGKQIIDNENLMPTFFSYNPTEGIHASLYNMVNSACDGLGIKIVNVVEHKEDYSVNYYFHTSNSYSYIKFYIDASGFVSYAKPLSFLGDNDSELKLLLEYIEGHFE